MILRQSGDTITMGQGSLMFTFRNSRVTAERFKAADVEAARTSLLAAYPDDAADINRYAARVLAILP
jgi:hypothetical protein